MKTLYIDCTNGVCADMFISGFRGLGVEVPEGLEEDVLHAVHHVLEDHGHSHGDGHHHHDDHGAGHGHSHDHAHAHGTSYQDVKHIIAHVKADDRAKETAQEIYRAIAVAEAKVHEATLDTVHFHEVGRPQAIVNVMTVAAMLTEIGADRIVCSEIHDGQGTIECSHGVIPVPVPAVRAMMDSCDYVFKQEAVETELVTPSGLGMLIGMRAVCASRPQGSIIAKGIGYGGRDTGRGGMEIYLIDEE